MASVLSRKFLDASDVSESYRYLSNEETEVDTNIASATSPTDLSFIRRGARVLDEWDNSDANDGPVARFRRNNSAAQRTSKPSNYNASSEDSDESDDGDDSESAVGKNGQDVTDEVLRKSSRYKNKNAARKSANAPSNDSMEDVSLGNGTFLSQDDSDAMDLSPSVVKKKSLNRKANTRTNTKAGEQQQKQQQKQQQRQQLLALAQRNSVTVDDSLLVHSTPLADPKSRKNSRSLLPGSIMKRRNGNSANNESSDRKRNVSFQLKQLQSSSGHTIVSPTDEITNSNHINPVSQHRQHPLASVSTRSSSRSSSSSSVNSALSELAEETITMEESLLQEIRAFKELLEKKEQQLHTMQETKKQSKGEYPVINTTTKDSIHHSNSPLPSNHKVINCETVPELAVRDKKTGERVYEKYELDTIDSLSLEEAQNNLKNICLKLSVPYSLLQKTVCEVPDIVKSEKHLLKFANMVHRSLYRRDIKMPFIGMTNGLRFSANLQSRSPVQQKKIDASKVAFLKCLREMEGKVGAMAAYFEEVD